MRETIRKHLSRQKLLFVLLSMLAIPVSGLGGGLLTAGYSWAILLVIVGVGMFLASMWILYFGMRCLKCGKPLGLSLVYLGGPFAISKRYNFCPCCGVSLDSKPQKE